MKYRIGIDLGGTAIKAGVVDENYQILAKRTIRTCPDFETACREMGDLVKDLLQDTQISPSDLESVGIGTPGFINPESGLLVFSPNTQWHNVPLREELGKYIQVHFFDLILIPLVDDFKSGVGRIGEVVPCDVSAVHEFPEPNVDPAVFFDGKHRF